MANPMYRQIAEDLRRQIESGALGSGSQLPTEYDLRYRYDASRNTIRDAIKLLTQLGLVTTRAGQGTFVTPKTDPFVTTLSVDPAGGSGGGDRTRYRSQASENGTTPSAGPVRVTIEQASTQVASALWVSPEAEVISRQELRFIDGAPWSLQTSYYPSEFADRGASRLRGSAAITEGAAQYLTQSLGLRQVGYRDWITMRAPSNAEADFLAVPADGRVPVYEISRTAFDGNGQPIRLTVTVYPTDRNQFVFEAGEVPELRSQSST